jgi:DNA-binding FadR family transcriptional regulator
MRALLSHETGEAIRDFIVERGLKPGDALPSEAELAALLDVGKTSVREALRRLEAHGVVEVRRGKGLFVDLRRPTADDHAAIVDALRSGDRTAMTDAVARHFEDLQRSLDADVS